MSPKDFLQSVWPGQGFYCILTWFNPPDTDKLLPVQKVFDTQVDALAYANKQAKQTDVYFAVGSLRKKEVWDPKKRNHKTGEEGAFAIRTRANILALRSFFLDIDVGTQEGKYSTLEEAVAALKGFIDTAQLPWPTLVSSGGGLHVYWPLTEDFATERWAAPAAHLRQLVDRLGLRADHSRTEDSSSVLRVPGTFNWKDKQNPREVKILRVGEAVSVADFSRAVSDALVRLGSTPAVPKAKGKPVNPFGEDNTTRVWDGPRPAMEDVGAACAQFRYLASTRGNVPENSWYHGILNTAPYMTCGDLSGRDLAHELSKGYAGYSEEETDVKLDQLEAIGAPARCSTIREHSPRPSLCEGCRFAHDPTIPNPIVAAARSAKAEAPQVLQLQSGQEVTTDLPDPPAPFIRLKDGGIAAVVKIDDDGNETTEIIYPYDLYPVRRLINRTDSTEQHLWRVNLPREKDKEFLLDADALYDQRKFVLSIANHGIYPHRSQLSRLQEYMTAYINELQRMVDADIQANHLGWSEDFDQFTLPDRIICKDGSMRAASLSLGAQRASAAVARKGDMMRQIELMRFYNDRRYTPSQFLILCSFAAPLYYMTGHHGTVINAAGDSGASKSTTLYTAASIWGHPKNYPINGTEGGATTRARNERVSVLANLPVCVDEITHMHPKEAADLAMGITQPGHRLRLNRNGVEQPTSDAVKSTLMLTTANSSLHALLSADNTAGTAGSMRVIEIYFKAQQVHQKYEADAFLLELYENYGWLGEPFIRYCMQNEAAVKERIRLKIKELDEQLQAASSERFYTAVPGTAIVAGEIANQLGLLSFDTAYIQEWWINDQMPQMRGVVTDEYSDPLSIVADYLEKINQNIMIVQPQVQSFGAPNLATPLQKPHGQLLARYDTDLGVLYVLKSAFKNHCTQIGANSVRVIDELGNNHPHEALEEGVSPKIVLEKRVRRTLGAGTDVAKAQTWCFAINMKHPLVAGKPQIQAVTTAANDSEAA